MALITIDDKVQYQENPLADINKWTAADINHFKTVINTNALREWDNTQNKFPDSGGSGVAGAIGQHNWFIGNGVGAWDISGNGSEPVPDGMIFIARIANPGQAPSNWLKIAP